MYQEEREDEILAYVKERKSASVKELAAELFVSEATIRRDLIEMEKRGALKRSHGGAMVPESSAEEPPLVLREQKNTQEKRVIAGLAAELLKNSGCCFMDSSTSTAMLIPFMKRFGQMTVVTNGLNNAIMLTQMTDAKVYISSGIIQSKSNAILGSDTVEYLSGLHADFTVMSCAGIDLVQGITEASLEQAKVKMAMIRNSDSVILLADSSKFGKKFLAKSCSFDKVNYIITDKMPPTEYVKAFEEKGCIIKAADRR